MTTPVRVIQATVEHLAPLSDLFQAYRDFYGEGPDEVATRDFLAARLAASESVVYLALDPVDERQALGFVQLFPTFSSLALTRAWILNDLFIAPAHRKRGVARCLIHRAHMLAEETGAAYVELATSHANLPAQSLYESFGYARERTFIRYRWDVPRAAARSAPAS